MADGGGNCTVWRGQTSAQVLQAWPQSHKNGSVVPHQITELAGAIGTAELLGGNRKRSRKMFAQSMSDPTGNALAQGEWASPHFGTEIVPTSRLDDVPEAFEAKALHLYREKRFSEMPLVCEAWAEVDPFSIRPFEFGASTAGFIEDFDMATKLAKRGLKIRQNSPRLLNLMALALASDGHADEAEEYINRMPRQNDEKLGYLTSANKGLVAYRQGHLQQGRRLYMEAVEGFRRLGENRLSAHARVYLARESVAANETDAEQVLSHAKVAIQSYKNTEGAILLTRIRAARAETSGAGAENA